MGILPLRRCHSFARREKRNKEQDDSYASEDSYQIPKTDDIGRTHEGTVRQRIFHIYLTRRVIRHDGIIHSCCMRTEIIHDIQRKAGNDQLTEISRHEAVGVQSCTLDRIICHHGT